MDESFDVVVVGGGQAGLATSRALQQRGLTHVVLERARIGETWRSQRWDSFRLNTPGWANALPGLEFPGGRESFGTATDLVGYFEEYRRHFGLPVREGVAVRSVRPDTGGVPDRGRRPEPRCTERRRGGR